MIARICGKLVERRDNVLLIDVNGLFYEVIVPRSVNQRIDEHVDDDGCVGLITFHYFQMSLSRGIPVLIGFLNEIEKEFFEQFITVSGIGPRAAVKALDQPISAIAKAINEGDQAFLTQLPGVGRQKSKEIIAKLQGKIGKFGLIQDRIPVAASRMDHVPDWQEETMAVLLQLQYKRQEARDMIQKVMDRKPDMASAEELLNEIYKQRINQQEG